MNSPLLGDLLKIPKTLDTVVKYWQLAEEAIQQLIEYYFPNCGEEFITQLFHGIFARNLMEASQRGEIAEAFLNDLEAAFPELYGSIKLSQIANGLIADVTLHKRSTEKITGGDMGFMIIRPQVARSGDLVKINDYRRGILCQAKLQDVKGRWGHLTKKQKEVLPERLAYLCLLLYSYKDIERHNLRRFQWYICNRETTISQLEEYLKKGNLAHLVESDTIIPGIGQAILGTDEDDILDRIISPAKNPSLIITISWPDGRSFGPGSYIYVYERSSQNITTSIRQTLSQ